MANTYTLISSVTVGSGGTSSISFTSIPQTYTDLKLVHSLRTNKSEPYSNGYMSFNGSGTYTDRDLYGEGSGSPGSSSSSSSLYTQRINWTTGNTATANTFGSGEVYIPNYTSSNAKSISADNVCENNATASLVDIGAGSFSGTSAINSITIIPPTGSTYLQYGTVYLYGISNA
jgi:hypothetical protein